MLRRRWYLAVCGVLQVSLKTLEKKQDKLNEIDEVRWWGQGRPAWRSAAALHDS